MKDNKIVELKAEKYDDFSDDSLFSISSWGADLSFREMAIEFTKVKDGFLSKQGPTHLLLGEPSIDNGFWYECIDGWQMLFQLDSMETDDICINFTDEGILCFYIDKEKLKYKDFSDVRIIFPVNKSCFHIKNKSDIKGHYTEKNKNIGVFSNETEIAFACSRLFRSDGIHSYLSADRQ